MEQSLSDVLIDFSQQTVLDHMESLYKMYPQYINKYFFPVVIYKQLIMTTTNYYNMIFKSLILKNDDELLKTINQMCKNHKATCILNILFQLSVSFLHVIMEQHHKLRKSTKEEYIEDINGIILNEIANGKKKLLDENLAHICTGKDLSECDPEEPLLRVNKSIQETNNMTIPSDIKK
jgi:hypothetical protein